MTLLVDANNLIFRELNNIDNPRKFNACHPVRNLWNTFSTSTDLTVFVWDGINSNARRREIFPPYKMNRPPKGEDVYAIVKLMQELLSHTPCMQVSVPTYEADDVIFTLAKFFSKQGDEVVVNTNDADYLQMADLPGVSLPCITRWEWDADLICTYKAMVGDPADNIPGIPGFGEGSWKNVQTYHETLQEALNLGSWELWQTIAFPRRNQKACLDRDTFDQVMTYYKVVNMIDVPIEEITEKCTTGTLDVNCAESLLGKYMI